MKYRKLGKTDLAVSEICFGCWGILGGFNWGDQDVQDSIAALQTGFEHGINFFDTAESYGDGASEALLAKALGSRRDEIVIASKVWPDHYQPDELRAACERSLGYLETDHIDLYQLHWYNPEISLAETIGVLEGLKEEGKIREYAVSNFGPRALTDLATTGAVCPSNQVAYSLLFRAIEFEIGPACAAMDISILTYSPLVHGLLGGRFTRGDQVAPDRARTRHFSGAGEYARHGEDGQESLTFDTVAEIRAVAEREGVAMSVLALAWLLKSSVVGAVIAGARNPDQARGIAAASDFEMGDALYEELCRIAEPLKRALGPNADLWEGSAKNRVV